MFQANNCYGEKNTLGGGEMNMRRIILVINLLFDANTPMKDMSSLKAEDEFQIGRMNFIMFYV